LCSFLLCGQAPGQASGPPYLQGPGGAPAHSNTALLFLSLSSEVSTLSDSLSLPLSLSLNCELLDRFGCSSGLLIIASTFRVRMGEIDFFCFFWRRREILDCSSFGGNLALFFSFCFVLGKRNDRSLCIGRYQCELHLFLIVIN
jgi:hypothetical protein